MAYAWGLTLPAAGLLGGAGALLADQGDWGIALLAAIGIGLSAWIYLASRGKSVTAHNVVDDVLTPGTVTPLDAPTAAAPVAA